MPVFTNRTDLCGVFIEFYSKRIMRIFVMYHRTLTDHIIKKRRDSRHTKLVMC